MSTNLANYNAARAALAAAVAVDEVKTILDDAIKMQAYARIAKDTQMENNSKEIRRRAQRCLGEMLQKQKKTVGLNQGAVPGKTGVKNTPVLDSRPTLKEVGIDKNLAKAIRRDAAMPEAEFEEEMKEIHITVQPPRKQHLTPAQEAVLAKAVLDEGKSQEQAETELGVPRYSARKVVERERGRREARAADPVLDPTTLSKTAGEKLEALKRSEVRKAREELVASYEADVRTRVNQRVDEILSEFRERVEKADGIMKRRKGIISYKLFRIVRSLIHPDSHPPERQGQAHDAFTEFNNKAHLLCDDKEMPIEPMAHQVPRTYAEWQARKAQATAERKAKRATQTPKQPSMQQSPART